MNPHRANIINLLNLLGSPSDQVHYQQCVPQVNVAGELVNQWFCDCYHPGSPQFDSAFSPEELHSLNEFNNFYDQRIYSLPNQFPDLQASQIWSEIVAFANTVLLAHGWKNVAASYES